ncbi:MAG: replication-associated recombination protein A [Actinobacteria bacterium]|nr:replication-associated recombination protein A [Actinomycetota bacterium]
MARKTDSLFSEIEDQARRGVAPLAVRMRPTSLSELVGQDDVVGEGTWLKSAIESDSLSSVVFFGPAGTGKTSLARIIASVTQAEFVEVSAVSGGVADLRREIEEASKRLTFSDRRTILFVDEIHRFSRSQQDALLHAVEDRVVILVGATTENPFFEVNSALLSRSRIVELHPLSDEDITALILRALSDVRGLAGAYAITQPAIEAIAISAGGDARMALTTLELSCDLAVPLADVPAEEAASLDRDTTLPVITLSSVREASPRRSLPYDKSGDTHYDVISAFIKSMRGSDPDAAVYWLARMIEGGEDPKFIARRIFILASEDIGNADPNALLVAHAAFKAAESIGYPECRITLSQAAIYMALAPKSNASYSAIDAALEEIRKGPLRDVPSYLRDRHRPGSEGYGPYRYPHSYEGAWVDQRYLPEGLEQGRFYKPTERGWEAYRTDAVMRDRKPLKASRQNGDKRENS